MVRPFDVPLLPGLDRWLATLVGDLPGHAASGELVASLSRVRASGIAGHCG
jgi:hypothetical protein